MNYRERVLPSVANLALPLILFPSVIAVMLPINASLALPAAALITAAFLAAQFFSSPVIEVEDNQLTVRGATIDLSQIGDVTQITKDEIFTELGRDLDARAWLSIQASVKKLIRIEITDPQDPTPYWLVTTRNPEKLCALLKAN